MFSRSEHGGVCQSFGLFMVKAWQHGGTTHSPADGLRDCSASQLLRGNPLLTLLTGLCAFASLEEVARGEMAGPGGR